MNDGRANDFLKIKSKCSLNIFAQNHYFKHKNKNILTGPANCKKTTRYHAHLPLCAK